LPPLPKILRAVGFDDGPFERRSRGSVSVAGVICAATRFEGLVWGKVVKDGWNSTEALCRMLVDGKFLPQIHLVLLDGIAFGGFNVVDLELLSGRLDRPCVAVMRREPDLLAVERAIRRLRWPERRLAILRRAGPIHRRPPFVFQVRGGEVDAIADALRRLTDRGAVPEALRLAHLVASAVATGESGHRA
jgi:endonuclease V-like protein UPF0215 family